MSIERMRELKLQLVDSLANEYRRVVERELSNPNTIREVVGLHLKQMKIVTDDAPIPDKWDEIFAEIERLVEENAISGEQVIYI